jgi:NTP pyrophosphatase (non-canonical NTP hydrolase)
VSNRRGSHVTELVLDELHHAYTKHGDEPWSRHEFYAILLEEVDELWDAIKRDEPLANVKAEAIQVAAVVVRFLDTDERHGFK